MLLVLSGVKRHSAALLLVEQDPVYTDISPSEEMDGTNASVPLLGNGRFDESVSRTRFEGEMVDDIFSDTNCFSWDSAGRKAYTRSLFCDVVGERSIVVGL